MRRGAAGRLAAWSLVLVALVALVRWSVVEPRTVESTSMLPTLAKGSTVLVEKVGPHLRGVHRGDVVMFRSPQDGGAVIKRVVAVGGQVVAIRDAVLNVDGVPVVEPQVDLSRVDGLWFGPVTVPPDHVFVLGDARAGSVDSRIYGSVGLNRVIGRVVGHGGNR
jgi:signal peptidase I